MMETYKPNFEKSYITANNILVSSDVLTIFPFKVKNIIKKENDIKCCSYKKAKRFNVNIEDFGSKSAVLIRQEDNKIIFYNEEESIPRIKFSILHEYGHYKLQHELDTKDEEMYKKFEVETNYFAAQLLMPEQLIRELQSRGKRITKEILIELFGVSEIAAQKRISTLNKNLVLSEEEKYFDDLIVQKYKSWLDSKVPPLNSFNMFFDEYERQQERDRWMYN